MRPWLKIASVAAVVALSGLVACSAPVDGDGEQVETDSESIIHGQHDPGHPAVVRLYLERHSGSTTSWASCTGTIVKTDPVTKVGWILTAAHCVRNTTNVSILQGEDTAVASGITRYAFLDLKAHPSYSGSTTSPYDVAMIRFVGAGATTPVMPILSPDGLTVGTLATAVGFGKTSGSSSAPANTGKNRIDGKVSQLSTSAVSFSAPNGSTCQGDSGGPLIVKVNGQERVAATLSYGWTGCYGASTYVRASAHAQFIGGILGLPAPAATCDLCRKTVSSGDEVCVKARAACAADAQCDGLRTCLSACTAAAADAGSDAGASDDCKKECSVRFPFGAGPYNTQVLYCSCRECGTTCSGDTACAAVPRCGMKVGEATCTTCLEGSCCAEVSACGADGHCYRCTKSRDTEGCAEDAKFQALVSCRAASCGNACAPAAPTGSEPAPTEPPAADPVTPTGPITTD